MENKRFFKSHVYVFIVGFLLGVTALMFAMNDYKFTAIAYCNKIAKHKQICKPGGRKDDLPVCICTVRK